MAGMLPKSDSNLKENISTMENSIEQLRKIEIY